MAEEQQVAACSVVSIFVAPSSGEPMQPRPEVRAVAGVGLEGDRYARGDGTYSAVPEPGRQVTLVELESIERVRQAGVALKEAETRRNIVTRGIELNSLVGREFRVGDVRLRGVDLCEPCAHMAQLMENVDQKAFLQAMVHRGGLRADILEGGIIRVGDPVATE